MKKILLALAVVAFIGCGNSTPPTPTPTPVPVVTIAPPPDTPVPCDKLTRFAARGSFACLDYNTGVPAPCSANPCPAK